MEDSGPDLYQSLLFQSALFNDGSLNFEFVLGIVTILLLLIISGLISAAESAYFSFSPFQIDNLKKSDDQKNKIIILLLENPKRLLATILVSNIITNVSLVILSSLLIFGILGISTFTISGLLIEIVLLSFLLLMFGEIIPKIYANGHNYRVACFMSRPLLFLQQLLYPLASLLVNATNIVDRRISHKGHNITMDELSEALELTESNTEAPEERKILKGILKFGDIAVREIMRPRIDVTAVDDTASFTELLEIVEESGYSRIPIYKDNLDNVTGILYIKDLIPHIHKPADFNWQSLQRIAFFVPENKKINDLLQEFQEKKIHLAIVVDEYGGTSGIVTLEDILEEIVGEINDEFDSETDDITYTRIDDNTYIFEGKTLLNDFCKVLGLDDRIFQEVKGESDTLAGLVLEMAGKIPDSGEQFNFGNFKFKPEVVDKRSIKSIRVILNEQQEEV